MAKVTAKLQVTVPKTLAEEFGIRPGDEIDWVSAGDAIRVVPVGAKHRAVSRELRARLFDHATQRQKRRQAKRRWPRASARGWKRKDLYTRGRTG